MDDRDHFAAAALTGILDKADAGKDLAAWWPEMACNAAYRWADAMLRERAAKRGPIPPAPVSRPAETRASGVEWAQAWSCDLGRRVTAEEERKMANHDASPEATACTDAATGEPGGGKGTGSTTEPVAWAVCDATWYHDVRLSQWTAEGHAAHMNAASGKCVYKAVPLYRQPQAMLTEEERNTLDRVAAFLVGLSEVGAKDRTKELLGQHAEALRSLLERHSARPYTP